MANTTHTACFDAWWASHPKLVREHHAIELLDAGFVALWASTRITLGSVTLVAVMKRVLATAADRYPPFSRVQVDEAVGLNTAALRHPPVDDDVLHAGARFVLVQYLTVVGNLTADILTPELHEALARAVLPTSAEGESDR